ncbi:hypothetical protein C8Q80DRAFT_1116654 [Daedaleopsis nitida]|nr:hypothetical protein C8Q80DRAFT_1116654 [Daedaleopsis nitida]
MVSHLNDPVALEEAKALSPKKYLVYIDCGHGIPSSLRSWAPYSAFLVAPELGIHHNSVIHIAPTTNCLDAQTSEDLPAVTLPFPYRDMCLWTDCELDLRVPVKPDGYNNNSPNTYRLDDSQITKVFYHLYDTPKDTSPTYYYPLRPFSPPTDEDEEENECEDQDRVQIDDRRNVDIAKLFALVVDPEDQYIPLVDLWLDIKEHFPLPTDISSPVGFWQEHTYLHLSYF